MSAIDRRRFLKNAAAAATTLGAAASVSRSSGQTVTEQDIEDSLEIPMPTAGLGRTGAKVSRLGLGCGSLMDDRFTETRIGAILDAAVEHGITLVDTAPNYGQLQQRLGPSLRPVRDRVFLTSKVEEPTRAGAWRQLRQSLKDLQTDRLDLVYLHSFGDIERWPDPAFALSDDGALGALREAKSEGLLRFIGVSGHNRPARYHDALDHDDVDVVMNPVNFVVQHTYDFEHRVWCRAQHKNLGLVAMKVLGGRGPNGIRLGGKLYESAIRYALSVPGISAVVIGCESRSEVAQAAASIKRFQGLTGPEWQAVYLRGLDIVNTKPEEAFPWGA